jgi:hypothetical protein
MLKKNLYSKRLGKNLFFKSTPFDKISKTGHIGYIFTQEVLTTGP